MSSTTSAPNNGLAGKQSTWLMIISTMVLAFVVCGELINVTVYDQLMDAN